MVPGKWRQVNVFTPYAGNQGSMPHSKSQKISVEDDSDGWQGGEYKGDKYLISAINKKTESLQIQDYHNKKTIYFTCK